MSKQEINQNELNATELVSFLYKWRKTLLIICSIAAIASAIASFLIREKFKSTVVLFPAATSSVSKSMLAENFGGKENMMQFGEEEQAEQLLQVLNSDEIRDIITAKYDLMKHYRIKPDEKYRVTKLIKEYEDNISFKRTEFQSVRIDVLDGSPDTAAFIANDISSLVDSVMNRMIQERAKQVLTIVETKYLELKAYIKIMEDSLTGLRRLGIHEYEVQIEMFTEQYSKALAEGNARAVKALEEKLNLLAEHGAAYVTLRDNLEEEAEKISYLRSKFEEARVDATQNIPHKFVVNRAFPAEKKTYPIRWLIVVVSTLGAFFLCVFTIIAYDNIQRARKQQQ